jgi:hypothetical protein
MSEQSMMRDLFDRWERVWHEGRFDLVPDSVGEHTSATMSKATGSSRARPMRRRLQKFGRSALTSVSSFTITPSKATVRGFALRSNGQIPKRVSRAVERACSLIELKAASL